MGRPKKAIPNSAQQWLLEISEAYRDARDTIPFGDLLNTPFGEEELFHLAPIITLKFRGLSRRRATLRQATDAALASYVANQEDHAAILNNPHLSFAFCYLVSHFGLDLLSEPELEAVMRHVEEHESELERLVQEGASPHQRIQARRKRHVRG